MSNHIDSNASSQNYQLNIGQTSKSEGAQKQEKEVKLLSKNYNGHVVNLTNEDKPITGTTKNVCDKRMFNKQFPNSQEIWIRLPQKEKAN